MFDFSVIRLKFTFDSDVTKHNPKFVGIETCDKQIVYTCSKRVFGYGDVRTLMDWWAFSNQKTLPYIRGISSKIQARSHSKRRTRWWPHFFLNFTLSTGVRYGGCLKSFQARSKPIFYVLGGSRPTNLGLSLIKSIFSRKVKRSRDFCSPDGVILLDARSSIKIPLIHDIVVT